MRAWLDVATLVKTRNLGGRFVVKSATGLPFLLVEGDEVAFVPPRTDMPRSAVVESVSLIDENTGDVSFDCVSDMATAKELVGSHCLVRRDGLDPALLEEPSGLWEGWTAADMDGAKIGDIVGIVENPGQSLLEISTGSHDADHPILVPIVDEIVREVDPQLQIVRVDMPAGLAEL